MPAPQLSPAQIQSSLLQLAEALQPAIGQDGKVALYAALARRLSALAHKQPPWSWRYIQGVGSGRIAPSQKLAQAVIALGATLDGVPPVAANTQPVQVYAEAGRVRPGSIVLAASRPCARPACPVSFVPVVPRQRYCSHECARKVRRERKAERKSPCTET
ncbi:MAG: hypothetical protein ACOYYS_06120 [Chloroflexota bacterium]